MHKLNKLGLASALAFAMLLAGATSVFAFGPERNTYTLEKPADHITFNSITNNNQEIGDERYFLSASPVNNNQANTWSDQTVVEDGKEYKIRMYVHNNAASNLKLTAHDVKAFVILPTSTAKEITVSGKISASNATPTTVWDETKFTAKNGANFNLAYVDGSAKYYNTKDGKLRSFNLDGLNDANDFLTDKGVLLGYDQMDGKIPGCNQYSGYLTFKVKAQVATSPKLLVQKEVKLLGENTWHETVKAKAGDTVRFRIHVKNENNFTVKNLLVRDLLPAGLDFVKGSATIVNTAHPKGVAISDNLVGKDGVNLGDYAAGAGAYLYFNAKVSDSLKDNCQNAVLRNIAKTTATQHENNDLGSHEDDAKVLVDGKVCETPKTPETPSEHLPNSGPSSILSGFIGLASIATAGGYYLISCKKMH